MRDTDAQNRDLISGPHPDPETPDTEDLDRSPQRTPWDTLSAHVISFVSRKGGVGKTTSAVNLGATFALSGHSVLLVGLDPQCGICPSLGCEPENLNGSLCDIFSSATSLSDLANTTSLKNLFFVSPNIRSLEQEESFHQLLAAQVDTFVGEIDRARNLYDTILIDPPPGLGPAARAALLAADGFLVPVQAEELCRESLPNLLDFIESFRQEAFAPSVQLPGFESGSPLSLEGLFLTMVNNRTRMSRHVRDKVTEQYGQALCEIFIPRTTRLTEMALRGKPAVIYDRKSPGSRAYFDLMDELVIRYKNHNGARAEEPSSPLSVLSVTGTPAEESKPIQTAPAATEPPSTGLDADDLADLLSRLKPPQAERGLRIETGDPVTPEIVSLDDLLAEEERAEKGPRDDSIWEEEDDFRPRLH